MKVTSEPRQAPDIGRPVTGRTDLEEQGWRGPIVPDATIIHRKTTANNNELAGMIDYQAARNLVKGRTPSVKLTGATCKNLTTITRIVECM